MGLLHGKGPRRPRPCRDPRGPVQARPATLCAGIAVEPFPVIGRGDDSDLPLGVSSWAYRCGRFAACRGQPCERLWTARSRLPSTGSECFDPDSGKSITLQRVTRQEPLRSHPPNKRACVRSSRDSGRCDSDHRSRRGIRKGPEPADWLPIAIPWYVASLLAFHLTNDVVLSTMQYLGSAFLFHANRQGKF